ncbi:MAG: acyltransferase [Hyphomicrobiaceae bacterium]
MPDKQDISAKMGRVAELDGLRAVSVIFIVLFHLTYGRLSGGFLGVDIFFVLSGFLITELLVREYQSTGKVDLFKFYMRRACRILPPLAVCLVLALMFWPSNEAGRWHAAVASLLFYANFLDAEKAGSVGHTWSLALEEQFYILWPTTFIVLFARSRRALAAFACCIVFLAIAVRYSMLTAGVDLDRIYTATPARMDSLMIGCLAGLCMPELRSSVLSIGQRSAARVTLVAWLALLAALILVSDNMMKTLPLAFSGFALLAVTFIVFVQSCASNTQRFLASPQMRYIGTRSYGLYLYHYPIFAALEPLRVEGNLANYAAVSSAKIALSLLLTEVSWRLLEQQILKMKNRQFGYGRNFRAADLLRGSGKVPTRKTTI